MSESRELPKYNCHKQVWALKIASIEENPDGTGTIVPEDERYAPFEVTENYLLKHEPNAGGYFVVYKGGYRSFSPAAEFEEGYTLA